MNEQIISKPELKGRKIESVGIECPDCKAARRRTISGAVPFLYRLVESDPEVVAQLVAIGLPAPAPIADSERGSFCLTGHP
jgi:hypothetical protein